MYAKEEEVCELQVKLQERDSALKAYKTENGRYADMKDKYKADIASLQQQVCLAPCTCFLHTLKNLSATRASPATVAESYCAGSAVDCALHAGS